MPCITRQYWVVRRAERVPVISTWQEIEKVAGQEIERAFYGDITAEEAARLAFQRTEEYFVWADSAAGQNQLK